MNGRFVAQGHLVVVSEGRDARLLDTVDRDDPTPAFQNRSVTITEGSVATLKGTIVDARPVGPFALQVRWGDASVPELVKVSEPPTSSAAAPGHPDAVSLGLSGQLSLTHIYHKAGTFNVHLIWGDRRGASNTADLVATMLAPRHRG
jgi:hypothetical protein